MHKPLIQKKIVHTKRLCLKPYQREDKGQLVELLRNEKIAETFMIPDYESEEQFLQLADKLIDFSQAEDTIHLEYGIYLQNRLIGFVNDCGIEDDEIEIGYVIHPDAQGHGYATEAVNAVISQLWEMGVNKVSAGFFEENLSSRRVMEKCGMILCDRVEEEEYRGQKHRCLYCEIRNQSKREMLTGISK